MTDENAHHSPEPGIDFHDDFPDDSPDDSHAPDFDDALDGVLPALRMSLAAVPKGATHPLVILDPWEYEHATSVGTRRATTNWETTDRPSHQNNRKQEDGRTASTAAAIAQLAVAKHLGLYWPGTVWAAANHAKFKHLPDVFPNIEVRRVKERQDQATVSTKDLAQGLALVVAFPVPPNFRQVEILGWLPCDEAWEIGTAPGFDATCHTRGVTIDQLRAIDTYCRPQVPADPRPAACGAGRSATAPGTQSALQASLEG